MASSQPHRFHTAVLAGWLLAAVLAGGAAYLVVLQLLTPAGVFFSGDAGLKALLARDLAAGSGSLSLDLPTAGWARQLWDKGQFAYQPPFVYNLGGQYFIAFTYTFPLLSALPLAWLGLRGLLLLPLLATLATWGLFYLACRKLELSRTATLVGLALLIFCSHFSLYGATYSEHNLAVCLSFAGLYLATPRRAGGRLPGAWAAAGAGLLTALAVWLRPEQIFVVAYLGAFSVWGRLAPRLRAGQPAPGLVRLGPAYLAAALLALLAYGVSNLLIYGDFFGAHAIQVLGGGIMPDRTIALLENLRMLVVGPYSFFWYMPAAFLPLALLALGRTPQVRAIYRPEWNAWYGLWLFFLLGTAALVPLGAGGKQWGPRFLLLLAPVVALLAAWQLDCALKAGAAWGPRWRRAALGLLLALGLVGTLQNVYFGTRTLLRSIWLTAPAVAQLSAETQAAPGTLVVIDNQYIAQVLQPVTHRETIFVLAMQELHLARVADALLGQGRDTFTYVCYSDNCTYFIPVRGLNTVERGDKRFSLETLDARAYGRYTILHIRVRQVE